MTRMIALAGILSVTLGCSQQAETSTAPVAEAVTATSFNAPGAPTVAFSVPNMMCPDSCAVKAKEILAAQPGVKDVQVDFDTKTATVAVEDGEFDRDAALAALTDRFDAATLTDGAVAKPQETDGEDAAAVQ